MQQVILIVNAGSSSIKFSIFNIELHLNYHGEVESIFNSPSFSVSNSKQQQILQQNLSTTGFEFALQTIFNWIQNLSTEFILIAVGHRVVHGGTYFVQPTLIDADVIKKLQDLNSLAPLHQPYNIEVIKIIHQSYPKLKQVACFDTTFHQTQNELAKLFAIPRALTEEGIIRYGFHGISYEYIASVMQEKLGDVANNRVITAHLGNGASMCAMYQRRSIATSMGFTALDGLMMGTRTGQIDPGVLLYLLQHKNYSVQQLEHLLYLESGLLGVSTISSDVRDLLTNQDIKAQQAIDLFCYRAALEVGALSVALKGLDVLIFTAGIGEHQPKIRAMICDYLKWLGIELDDAANKNNGLIISTKKSSIVVAVIPTNEELMIAKHTKRIITEV